MKKEATRISAAVMSVVVAAVTALGYTLAPDQQQAIAAVVTAVINLALILGVGEYIRSRVFSQESHDADVEMAKAAGEGRNPGRGPAS